MADLAAGRRPPRSVAIVGGGVAGLTLAIALESVPIRVTIHEAQPERVGGGAAVGLWPGALRTLASLGVRLDRGGPRHRVAGRLHDLSGRRSLPSAAAPVILIHRAELLAALSRALPHTVRYEVGPVDDPTRLDADLVVGADGVRSVVRAVVHPAAAERLTTPYVALRGLRPGRLAAPDYGEYWGTGRLFGALPVGPDATYWFTTHRSALGPEPLDVAAVLAEARTRFRDAAPLIGEVLGEAGQDTLATRIWVTPPMPRYVRGRYAVVGDAAHATTPNLGRGACDAVLDAASLGRAIRAGQGLTRWQARRLPPTQVARVASQALMRVALSSR